MKWREKRWGLICSILDGPEGRQVPRWPVRWMLHDSKFELELGEWKHLSQACCVRVVTAPSFHGRSSEVRLWKPALDESLPDFSSSTFFLSCPHHTAEKYSTHVLEKSVFTYISWTYHEVVWKWKVQRRTKSAPSSHTFLFLWLKPWIKSWITEHFVLI